MMDERIVSPKKQAEDERENAMPVNLRPNSLADLCTISVSSLIRQMFGLGRAV